MDALDIYFGIGQRKGRLSRPTMSDEHMTPALARAARAILKWSMEDLAGRTEVSITTVRDYENGSRRPHRLTARAFAKAFREEGIEFVGGADEVPGLRVHRPELLDCQPPRQGIAATAKKRQPKGVSKA
jgi:transcriptional regulator with XRE-family HTH domain